MDYTPLENKKVGSSSIRPFPNVGVGLMLALFRTYGADLRIPVPLGIELNTCDIAALNKNQNVPYTRTQTEMTTVERSSEWIHHAQGQSNEPFLS